jgi:hypothetical protein
LKLQDKLVWFVTVLPLVKVILMFVLVIMIFMLLSTRNQFERYQSFFFYLFIFPNFNLTLQLLKSLLFYLKWKSNLLYCIIIIMKLKIWYKFLIICTIWSAILWCINKCVLSHDKSHDEWMNHCLRKDMNLKNKTHGSFFVFVLHKIVKLYDDDDDVVCSREQGIGKGSTKIMLLWWMKKRIWIWENKGKCTM